MSSRKNSTVTGCTGWVSGYPFMGDHVSRQCSECGFASNFEQCSEFRKMVQFTRVRA